MAVIEISRIQVRRGQENQTGVPTLAGGEFGWAADTENLYIGLRREDGGARDDNVRILTENDLVNFFSAVQEPLDSTGYTYRSETYTGMTDGITALTAGGQAYERLLRKKADDFVSIADFGVIGVGNETTKIQKAVDNLFLDPLKSNSKYGENSAKILYLPAGTYDIDTAIFVPAYTTIVGEGIGKTIINLISDAAHAFQTVGSDAATDGRTTFEDGISSGITQPNYLHLEGMTIKFDSSLTNVANAYSLISVDCSEHALIKRVKFIGNHLPSDAVNIEYSGIDIRGNGALQVSSENVLIDNCTFDGLYSGVKSNYDIVNPIVQNSKFYNSVRGVSFNDVIDVNSSYGPRYARILNNRFENIEQEAIYAGEAPTGTYHVSMNNQFYNVGNGGINETTPSYPVITYLSEGNITVNDYFDRQDWQTQHTTVGTYQPLVKGLAALDSASVNTRTLVNGVFTSIVKLPITTQAQHLVIKYHMFEGVEGAYTVDRMGTFKVNLQSGVDPINNNMTDEYSYGVGEGNTEWLLVTNSGQTYYDLQLKYSGQTDITFTFQTSLML